MNYRRLKVLDEIVYWLSIRGAKKDMGAVSTVSPDLLMKIPVSGIDQAFKAECRSSGYTNTVRLAKECQS